MTAQLDRVRGYVFDVDGTLAMADSRLASYQPLPGARELLAALRERRVPYVAFTNGTAKTPGELSDALGRVGLPVEEPHALTPISVAVDHFRRRRVRRVLVLGVEGVWRPLADVGFDVVVAPARADDADVVLIGWYPGFALADVDAASRALWNGAAFYTVSTAPWLATRDGRTVGISAALTAAVRAVTGRRATVLGKPSRQALACASGRLGVEPGQMAIVADDPALENVMARRGGALSVAVHTGLGSAADFARLPAGVRPHLSLAGVDKLLELIS